MQRRLLPGLAFSLPTDAGFAVGLATHDIPRLGTLSWIAAPTFDEEPDIAAVEHIQDWRWPVFFPLNAALRRKIVTKIGHVEIPAALAQLPQMRSGSRAAGWRMIEFPDPTSLGTRPTGDATHPSVPIYQVVNDTRLREMIVSAWRPEDAW